MKTLVIRNADNTARVEYKTDLSGSNDAFTVMEVIGLNAAELHFGINFPLKNSSLVAFKTFCTANNLILDVIDMKAGTTTNLIALATALDITSTSPLAAGTVSVAERTTILCVADTAGSLNNKYFTINSPTVAYYVWFNVNSAGVDPAIAGKVAIPVAIATGATNAQVATAVAAALDGLNAFVATADTATVTSTNAVKGVATNATDGNAGVTTTVTIAGADTPYSVTLTVVGAHGGKTWTVSTGTLPEGLTLAPKTGIIAGNPSATGASSFTVTCTDDLGQANTQALAITVA